MEHVMIARVYALIAEMEALKAEIEVLKREWPEEGEHMFQEKADQIRGVAGELQQLEISKMAKQKLFKEYKFQHCEGNIAIDTIPENFNHKINDLDIEIDVNGKVWICINVISFLRFSPKYIQD